MSWRTVGQVAAILGLSEDTVYRLCGSRRLAHRRVGLRVGRGRIEVSDEGISAYLVSCEVGVETGDSAPRGRAKPAKGLPSGRPDGKPIRDHWPK